VKRSPRRRYVYSLGCGALQRSSPDALPTSSTRFPKLVALQTTGAITNRSGTSSRRCHGRSRPQSCMRLALDPRFRPASAAALGHELAAADGAADGTSPCDGASASLCGRAPIRAFRAAVRGSGLRPLPRSAHRRGRPRTTQPRRLTSKPAATPQPAPIEAPVRGATPADEARNYRVGYDGTLVKRRRARRRSVRPHRRVMPSACECELERLRAPCRSAT